MPSMRTAEACRGEANYALREELKRIAYRYSLSRGKAGAALQNRGSAFDDRAHLPRTDGLGEKNAIAVIKIDDVYGN